MKILVTGMNKNQVTESFYLNQQLKVVPSHYSLLRCLRGMGHEVEQRYVKIGEDLSDYDRVICFLASPRQALQLAFYNGLWAIHATPKDRLILAFDDWQTEGIFKGILSCTDKDSLLKDFTISQNSVDPTITKLKLEPHTDVLLAAVDYIGSKEAPVLLSVFSGGDLSKLITYPEEKLFGYNPNPCHRNRIPGDREDVDRDQLLYFELEMLPTFEEDYINPENKEKKFNFASLVQGKTARWLKKQNVSNWDIEYFGSRKEKQRRLTERDMCQVYAEQWGCLMPGYDHAGSGWWRARPLQVADAGSILIGEYEEMILLYNDPKLASLKASDIEDLNANELLSLAQAQKSAIYNSHPLDINVQEKELKKALRI